LKSDGALDQLREMTMATKSRILSSVVLTAATLVIVPLSSDEASARGGSGGARSSSAMRSSPAVVSRARTVTTSVHKLSTTSTSHRKLTATPVGAKKKSNQMALQAKKLREVEPGKGEPGKEHGGSKIDKQHPEKKKHPRFHPIYPVGIGAVPAPVAVDPPGCVYERQVQKLPGGGVQRVIVKICPDA
jgi:hypothetical protein